MQRLLSIALYKMRYQKASKRLLLIYFILLVSTPLVLGFVNIKTGNVNIQISSLGVLDFPFIWHFVTYISTHFKFLLLMVIVSLITMEFSNQTLKQNLIDGLSKGEFIASKCYMMLLFVGLSTVFVGIASLFLGLHFSDYAAPNIIIKDLDYLAAFFVELMGFFSFGLFLSMLIRRSGFVIGTVMIWYIAENFVLFVLPKIYHYKTNYLHYLLPLKAMDLIKEPFTRTSVAQQIINQTPFDLKRDYTVQWDFVLAAVLWSALFIWGSYVLLKKKDL